MQQPKSPRKCNKQSELFKITVLLFLMSCFEAPILRVKDRWIHQSLLRHLLRSLGDLAFLLHLEYGLDDPDGHGLLHVAHGKAPQGRVVGEALHAHGLRGLADDDGGVPGLDELGVVLQLLARPPVHLLHDLLELAGDVGRVAVQHRRVPVLDLARVVQDDDLNNKASNC